MASLYDNLECSYLQKNDFDLLTSNELDLWSRSINM